MHDLRRQALESGKTVSKKAKSKHSSQASSPARSPATSRVASRNASRHGSDEEEGNLSDETSWRLVISLITSVLHSVADASLASVNSIDEILSMDDPNLATDAWVEELGDRIQQIVDRKRSSVAGREESLAAYCRILTCKYAKEELDGKIDGLAVGFLRSVKAESSEKETVLALRALALTLVTDPSDSIYDLIFDPLKRSINDSESFVVKAAAIQTLSTATFYGGASLDETQAIMDYLLEVIESDGLSVDAGDSSGVVTAALEEWGFLATQLDDLEESSQEAMEAFVEQLESSHPGVQIAAGENIALLYEKSYTELEDDEEIESSDDEDPANELSRDGPRMVKRYDPYRRPDQLKHLLSTLATVSSRRISKRDKKCLHTNFADILNSVENPTRGPRYQNALNHETGKRYGSRMNVRIHRTGVMRIDRWWKLLRLQALRRVLGGGFVGHYEKNEVVFDSLP
ncbi:MAG: hypothetical protein M1817_003497 [Caeruleum heppii]|nr:MAG: hypothetical protein M1817_003497 [Caeruleum heppii]